MFELKFAIYHRAANLSPQASLADVCSIGWRIIDQTRLSSNTLCIPTVFQIQQSCVIIAISEVLNLKKMLCFSRTISCSPGGCL